MALWTGVVCGVPFRDPRNFPQRDGLPSELLKLCDVRCSVGKVRLCYSIRSERWIWLSCSSVSAHLQPPFPPLHYNDLRLPEAGRISTLFMAKRPPVETAEEAPHPYDFEVSGPRNLSSPNWRDIIISNWRDANYKRAVMACFIQAAYLLELDRQQNKTEENGLATRWCKPFKYKVSQKLVDDRDGSIFGALLEWDRSAALSDFILMRPSGAPRAVLALRGTLLKSSTIRRDLQDDLRFLAWESLKGSVRFNVALEALKSVVERFGSSNVCVAGHSLGAGFALQVGKALAKEGIFVETHLFNPPSVSLAMSLRGVGEKVGIVWKKMISMFHSDAEIHPANDEEKSAGPSWGLLRREVKKWIPHIYVNNSDYICCYYTHPMCVPSGASDVTNKVTDVLPEHVAAKLYVMSKGPQRFLEAHGLEQWWSDDLELQQAIHNSKLISRQLKSLYTFPPPSQGKSQ